MLFLEYQFIFEEHISKGGTMQIRVRTPMQNTISISINKNATVFDLKHQLEAHTGFLRHDIGLVCI